MRSLLSLSLLLFFTCTIYAQSDQLDNRALKHYSKEQVASLSVVKKAQINYYYQHSFFVNKGAKVCNSCPEIDPSTIDIANYEKHRLQDKRATVFLTEPGYPVVLLSAKELEQEYDRIRKSFNKADKK